jgi:hypothetical protein
MKAPAATVSKVLFLIGASSHGEVEKQLTRWCDGYVGFPPIADISEAGMFARQRGGQSIMLRKSIMASTRRVVRKV